MTPEPLLLLALALLGGAVALDGTSVGQFMVSRPLVAATLGGLAAGRPAEGIAAGVVLEALHLAVLPVGAAIYPESGPPAVAAGAAFAMAAPSDPALLVVVLFALAWEFVCGQTVKRMRQFNVRFDGITVADADPRALARRHWTPIAIDFARGALLTLLGVLLLGLLLAALRRGFAAFPPRWAETALWMAVAAGAASALRLFGRARWPWFAAGAVAGVAWLWVR